MDTNIWLSAALSRNGAPAQVLARILARGVLVFSASTFAELETRIWKPKFDRYLDMATRQALLHDARAVGLWVDVAADIAALRYCRDADDDKFIHTALAASALWLVTGDQDLLAMDVDTGVRIVTATEALKLAEFCP